MHLDGKVRIREFQQLAGGPTVNVFGLKSDARILLRLCIPSVKNVGCCLPSPRVLPGEAVSLNEKHVGIACFTDSCSSRPHRTLLWLFGAAKKQLLLSLPQELAE